MAIHHRPNACDIARPKCCQRILMQLSNIGHTFELCKKVLHHPK